MRYFQRITAVIFESLVYVCIIFSCSSHINDETAEMSISICGVADYLS